MRSNAHNRRCHSTSSFWHRNLVSSSMSEFGPISKAFFNSERKLYAILFADIQGYTSMMQADEDKALSRLSSYQEVLRKSVEASNGQVVKNYGDGSLCLFENTVDALNCAISIQRILNVDPKVPLRIGLHLGDVTFREGDIYGNDVNVASRIESMGIAGSILMSGDFWRKVKAKGQYSALSLGVFQFKNVEEKMELYALSQDGIVLPKKEELLGKLAPQQLSTRLQILVIGLIVMGAIVFGIFSFLSKGSASDTEISQANREKRLTILDFKNQTTNPELDVYGSMFSDWISTGLMNVDEANIINASNIIDLIEEDNLGTSANPEFAKATGIDLVVDGRYYYVEDKLIAIANLIEISSGKIIMSFQKESPNSETMTLLDDLAQEIVGYWAVRDNQQLAEAPPVYDAYVDYIEGMRLFTINAREAAAKFKSAFVTDSSFYPPLFALYNLYHNMADYDRATEALEYLEAKSSDLTKYYRVQLDVTRANHERNYLQAAEHQLKLTEMDPSNIRANRSAAYCYYLSNRPQKAIEVLNSFDKRLAKADVMSVWREELEAVCNYALGNYERTIEIVGASEEPRASIISAIVHLQSLVWLRRFDELERVYAEYLERGIYTPVGGRVDQGQILVFLCTELAAMGENDQLQKYADKLVDWTEQNEAEEFLHDMPDLYNNRPFRQEEIDGYARFFKNDIEGSLALWKSEDVPSTNWPDQIDRLSRVGVCHAYIGDSLKAVNQLDAISTYRIDHALAKQTKYYFSARILAALGRNDEATENIRLALKDGIVILRPLFLKTDPFLVTLIGYDPFENSVAPKG